MEDPLGDRMKALEAVEGGRRFDRGAIVLARIDGRSFSQRTMGANAVVREGADPVLRDA